MSNGMTVSCVRFSTSYDLNSLEGYSPESVRIMNVLQNTSLSALFLAQPLVNNVNVNALNAIFDLL